MSQFYVRLVSGSATTSSRKTIRTPPPWMLLAFRCLESIVHSMYFTHKCVSTRDVNNTVFVIGARVCVMTYIGSAAVHRTTTASELNVRRMYRVHKWNVGTATAFYVNNLLVIVATRSLKSR